METPLQEQLDLYRLRNLNIALKYTLILIVLGSIAIVFQEVVGGYGATLWLKLSLGLLATMIGGAAVLARRSKLRIAVWLTLGALIGFALGFASSEDGVVIGTFGPCIVMVIIMGATLFERSRVAWRWGSFTSVAFSLALLLRL